MLRYFGSLHFDAIRFVFGGLLGLPMRDRFVRLARNGLMRLMGRGFMGLMADDILMRLSERTG